LVAEVQTVQVVAEVEVVTQLVVLVCNPPLLLEDLEIREEIGLHLETTEAVVALEVPVDCLLVEQGARLKSSAAVERMPHLRQVATETYQAHLPPFLPW
jgi:hypothetical protein